MTATIAQLLPALDSGGVERGTLELGSELVRRGFRALVISAGGRMLPELAAAGIEHIQLPLGRKLPPPLELIPRLRRLLLDEQVDIVHARSRMPAWVALASLRSIRSSQRPIFVTTVHGFNSPGRYSSVMLRGDRVIAVSHAVRDFVLQHYPWLDPARLQVIHRGVDPQIYSQGFRPDQAWLDSWYREFPQLQGQLQGQKVITLPGRITRLKGHEDFLRLLAQLRDRGLAVQGLIVGGEHRRHLAYLQELQQQVAELGLAVSFTGHRSDLREIFAVSDLVLSLSTKPESFGRTVLEALSLGTPVLGYDRGGVGEVLAQLYPQGRVPPGDLAALTEQCVELLQRPQPVPAVNGYRLQQMLDATIELYQQLLAQR